MLISKLIDGSVQYLTTHTRDFIHVSDVVEAIVLLLNQNNRTLKQAYDIGTGKGYNVEDLGLLAGFGHLPVTSGEHCEALDNTADNSDLKALGWETKMNVEDYIVKKTVPY